MSPDLPANTDMTGLHPSHQPALRGIAVIVALLVVGVALAWTLPPPNAARGIAGYLPLHILLETASIVISMLVFAVGWNDFSGKVSGNLTLLACVFFGVACLDFTHTFSFYGMPDFVTPNGPDKAIYFWLTARALAAAGLLLAVAVRWRASVSTSMRYAQFAAVLVVVGVLHWLFLFHQDSTKGIFLVPGKGLTPLKLYLEYAIIAVNVATVFVLWVRMRKPLPFSAVALFGAVCTMAMSEFFFTLYAEVTDVFNLLGHIYKIISYLFIYRAFVVTTIEAPYRELIELNREQRRTTEALRMSEERYRQLFEKSASVLMTIEPDSGAILDANASAARFYGYSIDQLRTMNIDQINTLAPEKVAAERASAAKAERSYFIFPHRLASGDVRMVEVQSTPVEIDNRIVLFSIVHDITERMQAEEALRVTRFSVDAASDALFWMTPDARIVDVNAAACRLLGYTREELLQLHVPDVDAHYNAELWPQHFSELRQRGSMTFESEQRTKDGRLIPVEIVANHVMYGSEERNCAFVRDITERKQAEEALARESHRSQVFLRNASDGVHILDADGKVLEVSDVFCQMLGYSREELIGANVSLWDAQWSPQELKQKIAEQMAERGRSILETRHRRRDGSFLDVEVTGQGLELDGKPVLFNSARDITKRKRAEEALHKSEKDLQEAQRLAHVGSWDWDIATDTITWSEEYYHIYGIDPTQPPPGYEDHLKAYTPESAARLDAAVKRNTLTGESYELELELARTQGPRRWITARSETKRDAQGRVTGLRGTAQDITERKRAEEDHRAAARYARSLIEASLDPLVTINPAGKITDVNKTTEEVTGVEREHLIGTDFADYFTEPDKARAGYKEVLAQGYVRDYPLTIRGSSGRTTDVLYNATVYRNDAGELQGVFAAAHDITERKRAEEIRTLLAAIVQSSHDAIIGKDLDGVITSWNPGAEKVYGYSAEEVIGKPVSILAPESRKHEITDLLQNIKRSEDVIDFETERIRKDGTCIDIALDLSPIRDAAGRLVGASTIARDISEKKQAERVLNKVNRALKALSNCNEVLIHATDETRLLDDICRIIVDTGGFHLAWVGYVEHDALKTVRPVAHSGYKPGYMEHTNITWADDELGSGPLGIAIRTGEIQVVQDVTTDPRFEPWRANAVKLGYGSLLVAPLVSDSETIGALSIHAVGANAFDAGEIALLGELAADMAFGIATLRARSVQKQSAKRLQRSMEESIAAIAATVEMRDPYTGGHQRRVASLAVAIGHDLGLPEDRVQGIHLAAVVHDLGKVHVPAEILSKPGKLSGIEFELIKSHSQAGYDILKDVDFPWPIAQIVLQHHERLDGSGYPQGLKGNEILLESRILAVADVVEAMSSHRPYRPGLGIDKALAEIERGRGSAYDPAVADACLKLFRENGYAIPA